jgi:hypothetical protein
MYGDPDMIVPEAGKYRPDQSGFGFLSLSLQHPLHRLIAYRAL